MSTAAESGVLGRSGSRVRRRAEAAQRTARAILDEYSWETADMGKAEAARAIVPLGMLWCVPGVRGNHWSHAFKLLR